MNKKTILRTFTPVFGLIALLTCTLLATSATAESGGRLVGVFDTHLTLTNCHGVVIRTLEALQMFNQGGTLASTDNQPPSSRGAGFGTWQNMGGRSYSAPFQFFSFNPDGTFAGTVKIARNILLAADANSYTSTVSVEILDPNGNVIATLCGTESATRLFD